MSTKYNISKWAIGPGAPLKALEPNEPAYNGPCSNPSCTYPGCKTAQKARIKASWGGPATIIEPANLPDLPDGEEWVKKYFPKGSVIIGKVRSSKRYQRVAQELVQARGKPLDQLGFQEWTACAICYWGGPHTLPTNVNRCCSCGHGWDSHAGHNCLNCGTTQCFPVATVTGHWVQPPEGVRTGTVEGCGCKWCTEKPLKKGMTGLGRARRPEPKPTIAVRQNAVAANYGLDKTLILAQAAADFYLLVEMGAMKPLGQETDELFRSTTYHLADQLCLYLELACLGEFRHHGRKRDWLEDYKVSPKLQAELLGFGDHVTQSIRRRARNSVTGDDRMVAWSLWETLRKKYGKGIYELIGQSFRGFSWGRASSKEDNGCGYGGPKWAECIETAAAYRNGLPSTVFVDQALSLKHNGNIAYDKFWDVRGLTPVIEWALAGDTRSIQHYATAKVRELWQAWKKGKDEQAKA